MVSIKKQNIKAYILLESLIATGLFALIVNLVLVEIGASRDRQTQMLAREEAYQVAKMAIQTGAPDLTLNGVTVHVTRTATGVRVDWQEEVLLEIQEN